MDIKAFPEIGGEDGIWIEYTGGDYTLVPTVAPRKHVIRRIVKRLLPKPLPPLVELPPPKVAEPEPVLVALPEPVVEAAPMPEAPIPPYIPSWSEIWELVQQRITVDWSELKNWMRSKWSHIWRR